MPEIPECLHRRYRALDELISELSAHSNQGSHDECYGINHSHDPGIKLMCDFWNILKEDPDCNLSQAVKQRMSLNAQGSGAAFPRQRVTCYMAGRENEDDKKKDAINKIRDICSGSQSSNRSGCPTSTSRDRAPDMPLTKALCSLKEAASLDKKCNVRVMELMETQKELKAQIQNLEQREKEGVALLKEADCMWSCMEDEYKKKISESIERQKELMKQLREVEKSNTKWRKNKKELEDQLKSVAKCRQEMTDKTMHKKNDLKVIDMEMADFNRRIASNKRLTDGSKQVLNNKKTVSDKKIASIAADITKLKSTLTDVQKYKKDKEDDGQRYVKEAREDLQKICKTLLQKKIENEDLLAEKEAVLQEIDLLKQTCDQCKDKCQSKRNNIEEEIKKVDKEIASYRYQCVQCHQCTDTNDSRTLCSDCPKCKEQRECITSGDHCEKDSTYDCVCIGIKEKFLNNVFENMYTIMERQSKSKPGKILADSIVRCLKNSRNGKLNAETRQQVQEFVLNTVKKNLNLTIVGGAVKTRCEMDSDTYKQLMICLKQVKAEKPPKEDKGTVAKKESCRRWGGPSECNCPGGAKYCACTRRAPPPPRDPSPCPPVLEKEEDPAESTVVLCPHKESIGCGPDCAMHAVPSSVGTHLPSKPNNSCTASGCPFKKNMRAAQCVLGPESLSSLPKTYMSSTPCVPEVSGFFDRVNRSYDGASASPYACKQDSSWSREQIIEEVMGRYNEVVTPIEKVWMSGEVDEQRNQMNLGEKINYQCICNGILNVPKDEISQICDCSSDLLLLEGTDALIDMLRKKNVTHVCKTMWNKTNGSAAVKLIPKPKHSISRNDNVKVHVLLHPKNHLDEEKYIKTSKTPLSCSANSYSKRYENIYDRRMGRNIFSQSGDNYKSNVDDNNIQNLLEDVMNSDDVDDCFGSDVQWMNVESLIKLISSQSDEKKTNYNNVVDYGRKSFQKDNKSVKHYDHNLQMNVNHNKFRSQKNSAIRINNNFKNHRTKNNISESHYMASEHKEEKYLMSSAAQDHKMKRHIPTTQRDNQLKRWNYFMQTSYITEHKSKKLIFHNTKQNINSQKSIQLSSNKSNKNRCNINNYKGLVKRNKFIDAGKTKSSMTWPQNAKQLKAGYSHNSTCTTCGDPSINDIDKRFLLKQRDNTNNELLNKHEQQNLMTSNISSQATALVEHVYDNENSQNIYFKGTKKIKTNLTKPELYDKNIQSGSHAILVDLPPGNFPVEIKGKYIDLLHKKSTEDSNAFMSFKRMNSEHSVHFTRNSNRDCLMEVKKDKKTIMTEENEADYTLYSDTLQNEKPFFETFTIDDHDKLQSTQDQSILKFELQQKYEENTPIDVKFKTKIGFYKIIKAPVAKTCSGNIAININKLSSEVDIKNKECNVILTRSHSGAIILNKKNYGFTNAVIRKTASGSFLLVITEPTFQSHKIVNKITPIEHFYKIIIESQDNNTTEPPAVLKATPSHNYLVVPDKEYENQYRETIDSLLEDSTEYYVNLKITDSQNCILQIERNSWKENEPNALIMKTDSGDVKILTRRNAVVYGGPERKIISVTSSSKVLGGIMEKLPINIANKESSQTSQKLMIPKKSSSDSNIYEKVKLFYSDNKKLLVEPSSILKMTNSGQYAVILNKESKLTFIKNLKSYLKNNFQGQVPIKKTDSGEITIDLHGEHTDKNQYGSLKITPSGNLYVIVDKTLVKDITKDKPLQTDSLNDSVTDVTSWHIIGKLQRPVNKAVTTTCNAMPERDCDVSKCVCGDINLKKLDWLLSPYETDKTVSFFESQISGLNWRKVINSLDSYKGCENNSAESCSDSPINGPDGIKALPHIIIKPCTYQPLFNKSQATETQCFSVIESVCPFHENMPNWPEFHICTDVQSNSNWDSLTFLPPQLPEFLKDIRYT